jgi:hypothetical protein
MPADKPLDVNNLRKDLDTVTIQGDLYRIAQAIQRHLAAPDAGDADYVVRLAISLLHQAIGKDITFTDPGTGQSEEYSLWRQ